MTQKTILLFFLFVTGSYAQIKGCTDRLAKNFDPKATENNGSCEYASAKIKAEFSKKISDTISETSGLIAFKNLLWTHNDNRDTTLYGLDQKGQIKKKVSLQGLKNNDWEEISQDSLYLYIGDFGNNYRGNRKDLRILRIEKNSVLSNTPVIDTIAFSYINQTDFKVQKANTTDFDCEAFLVTQSSIYLFTKQWKQNKTSVYMLPKNPGTHIAQLKETINVEGLITGATYSPSKKLIVLCGYSKTVQPFVYLLYDYKNSDFSTGNKRKINILLPFHQIEGIATQDGLHYYVTNEALIKKPILTIHQKIHLFDLKAYLESYLQH
ncbi:MAG TPA: T9SS C-terminal target domain-containing protein [Flavobacterium sp.]|uniref:T9SS C-terminal target domain-containing protein n=1 Tax=Flavobacterium sp. TaxID=239 RepID=UPI002DBD6B28|nr:T9SS C-terminal target domain-containing protein [Flavobacterium sp.]HEU4788928.1 T9SS C-terminal target domain-containing protein [Flavobacterium sp.]